MLRELHVRNLALIEDARLEFAPGLNILSGETGAGKTVLVEALGLILGGRGDSALVSSGADILEVEAAFDIPEGDCVRELAREAGLELDGGEIIIRRVIDPGGRGRCYVNGRMCTVGTLARLGEYLVDIHGQNEHQRLLKPLSHLEYLDASGKDEHTELLRAYRELYASWRIASERLRQTNMDEAGRLREMDLLRYGVREIEAVNPVQGEMEDLLMQRKRMQHREELFNAVHSAYRTLSGEDEEGVIDKLGVAEAAVEKAASLDDGLVERSVELRDAQEGLAGIAHALRSYAESLDFEPGRLEEVELRLQALSGLARKYGSSTAAILEHLEWSRERLAELENIDVKREELRGQAAAAEDGLRTAADRLSKSRSKLAGELTRDTERELEDLNMAGMRFRVEITGAEDFGERGMDTVEFKISPGKGLPYRQVARIASGGELSRIMLALKLSLAKADTVPTLVFDEVDAGIGGTTADALAEKLARVSRYHQVFSITHLPQIAALSDQHMAVYKRETSQGVLTEVNMLDGDRRVDELVRMLGGDESTARKHALSMLKKS